MWRAGDVFQPEDRQTLAEGGPTRAVPRSEPSPPSLPLPRVVGHRAHSLPPPSLAQDGGPDTLLGYVYTPSAIAAIVISALLGILVSLSTFLVIGSLSSLSYNIIGHLKTVIILSGEEQSPGGPRPAESRGFPQFRPSGSLTVRSLWGPRPARSTNLPH